MIDALVALMNATSFQVVAIVVVLGGAVIAAVSIRSASVAHRRDAEIKHQEFTDSMDLTHRERLAQIATDRDVALAKMGVKLQPGGNLQLEGKRAADATASDNSGEG